MEDLLTVIFFTFFFTIFPFIPIFLTIWHIRQCYKIFKGNSVYKYLWVDWITIGIGMFYSFLFFTFKSITSSDWYVQLYGEDIHTFILSSSKQPLVVIMVLSFIAYTLIRKESYKGVGPLLQSLLFSMVYLGFGITLITSIQVIRFPVLTLFGFNLLLIYLKAILEYVQNNTSVASEQLMHTKYEWANRYLRTAHKVPLFGVILLLPLTIIVILVSNVFGQEPNSIIKAWSDTADWTFSQRMPPENLFYDQHYLCSVAAGGHQKVVNPLRTGKRHGNRIVVNRQLCIANAFEQVIQEKLPMCHKGVRMFYDTVGYPIAKHINSKWVADLVYLAMKPLEWFFLIVLYCVDPFPENRIAVQYPHVPL